MQLIVMPNTSASAAFVKASSEWERSWCANGRGTVRPAVGMGEVSEGFFAGGAAAPGLALAASQWRKLGDKAVERQKTHWPLVPEAIRPN
jgi:hypothetical protein